MTMMNHHDARGSEETMPNLPPVVPAGSASPTTGVSGAGVPDGPPAEDASELAQPEPGLQHHQPVMPADVCPRTQSGRHEKPVAAPRPAEFPQRPTLDAPQLAVAHALTAKLTPVPD